MHNGNIVVAQLLFVVIFFNVFTNIESNYFFDNDKVAGLTQEEWLNKCRKILDETKLHQVVFNIKGLCTQLRCLRDYNLRDVYIGFDFCMKSSTRCMYFEPDPILPYPECCPQKQCDAANRRKLMNFKHFMEKTRGYRNGTRKEKS